MDCRANAALITGVRHLKGSRKPDKLGLKHLRTNKIMGLWSARGPLSSTPATVRGARCAVRPAYMSLFYPPGTVNRMVRTGLRSSSALSLESKRLAVRFDPSSPLISQPKLADGSSSQAWTSATIPSASPQA